MSRLSFHCLRSAVALVLAVAIGVAPIADNDARDGGEIAMRGHDFDDVAVFLDASDPGVPVLLAPNSQSGCDLAVRPLRSPVAHRDQHPHR